METGTPTVSNLAIQACEESPKPLGAIYSFVVKHRPETAEETIRARIYEAVREQKIVRVTRGVYFARSGPAQLLLVEGDAWEFISKLDNESIDLLITDPPGKFGRDWAGQGTTRPHSQIGGRTYQQPDLDEKFMREAFRILRKSKEWNTLSKERRLRNEFPRGGAACLIRVPIENRTTRMHVQSLIQLAESVGFVFYGEIVVQLDRLGMGYDCGRDKGAKWLLLHATARNGVLWDLTLPNVIDAQRIRNPCKEDAVQHEAEKDPVEFARLVKATTRPGEVVLDCFAGRAKWAKEVLGMSRHVILCDVNGVWPDRIAEEDFGFKPEPVSESESNR